MEATDILHAHHFAHSTHESDGTGIYYPHESSNDGNTMKSLHTQFTHSGFKHSRPPGSGDLAKQGYEVHDFDRGSERASVIQRHGQILHAEHTPDYHNSNKVLTSGSDVGGDQNEGMDEGFGKNKKFLSPEHQQRFLKGVETKSEREHRKNHVNSSVRVQRQQNMGGQQQLRAGVEIKSFGDFVTEAKV